jgi:uncharacterized protein (TIGR02677 family)
MSVHPPVTPATLEVFRHVTADKAALYRAVLASFVAAKERFALHLRPREIAPEVRAAGFDVTEEALEAALEQLAQWGNLRAYADTTEVATVEEFHRKRRLFALTREGEGAERALEAFRQHLGTPGELKAAALEDIDAHLQAILALLEVSPLDGDKGYRLLEALRGRFVDLTEQAQVFVAGLRRAVDLQDVEENVFIAYKERLVEYLSGFIGALTVRQASIGVLLERLKGERLERLLDAAAAREMSDRIDAGPEVERELRAQWSARWRGLRAWFLSEGGVPAQAQLLHHFALDAIPSLLRAIGHLHDRRVQRSDRREDFRTLARWFSQGDDAAAHRLARVAFGMAPSRHLSTNAETLDAWEASDAGGATSWADAPPLRVTPRMRQTGHYTKRGRREKVVDRSQAREALAILAAREARELEAVRRRLVTSGRVRLSALGVLDPGAFGLFLDLLDAAYAARESEDGPMEATSADGATRIVLEPLPGAGLARIETAHGVLVAPECWVTIEDLTTSYAAVAE